MLNNLIALLIVNFLFISTSLVGEENTSITVDLALASSQHENGEYEKAISSYEKIISAGHINGHVFYNLGHAYQRNSQIGYSTASLLAAKRYLPRDPDVLANLKFVHSKSTDNLVYKVDRGVLDVIGFWLDSFTTKEASWLAVTVSAMSGMWVFLSFLIPSLERVRSLAYASLLVPLLAFGNLFLVTKSDQQWGAITASRADIMSGPGKSNKVLFVLNEGSPFLVTGVAAGWYRIALSDGKKGWVKDTLGKAYGAF